MDSLWHHLICESLVASLLRGLLSVHLAPYVMPLTIRLVDYHTSGLLHARLAHPQWRLPPQPIACSVSLVEPCSIWERSWSTAEGYQWEVELVNSESRFVLYNQRHCIALFGSAEGGRRGWFGMATRLFQKLRKINIFYSSLKTKDTKKRWKTVYLSILLYKAIQRSWVSEIPETKETSDWLASTRIRRLARILHGNITCLEIGTDTCRLVHYDYNASLALYSCCSLATWRCWPQLG